MKIELEWLAKAGSDDCKCKVVRALLNNPVSATYEHFQTVTARCEDMLTFLRWHASNLLEFSRLWNNMRDMPLHREVMSRAEKPPRWLRTE
jgi:hypothetical protein